MSILMGERSKIGRRILVVDDDRDIRENFSDILHDLGYFVLTAADGASALELLGKNSIDVALVDLRMPGMDGLTLAKRIKSLGSGVVSIIVTAYEGFASPEEIAESGAWRVVNKPVHFPALLSLVGEALEQPLVLVVDDDRPLCSNLWEIFSERGYRVSLVHDLHDAERGLMASDPRIILIDMKLPDGDGVSVLRMVRNLHSTARTVVITGVPGECSEQINEARREGVDAVCLKPFDVPLLLSLLKNFSVPS